jgi:hypothetical protein
LKKKKSFHFIQKKTILLNLSFKKKPNPIQNHIHKNDDELCCSMGCCMQRTVCLWSAAAAVQEEVYAW